MTKVTKEAVIKYAKEKGFNKTKKNVENEERTLPIAIRLTKIYETSDFNYQKEIGNQTVIVTGSGTLRFNYETIKSIFNDTEFRDAYEFLQMIEGIYSPKILQANISEDGKDKTSINIDVDKEQYEVKNNLLNGEFNYSYKKYDHYEWFPREGVNPDIDKHSGKDHTIDLYKKDLAVAKQMTDDEYLAFNKQIQILATVYIKRHL